MYSPSLFWSYQLPIFLEKTGSILFGLVIEINVLQILLSKDDLRMMINEVSGEHCGASTDADFIPGRVSLRTFLLIMEKSAW